MAYLNGEKILFSPQVHITTPEVVQTTGDSETAVMSQKAVTEAISNQGTVDQTYNPTSENAQSGKAVEEAIQSNIDQSADATSPRAQSGVAVAEAVDALIKIRTDETYSPTSENAQSGIAVAEALATVGGIELKPIFSHTVETPTKVLDVVFDKPLKEFWVRIKGRLTEQTAVSNFIMAAFVKGGEQYFVYKSNCNFPLDQDVVFTFHAKEVVPYEWETEFGENTISAQLQGLDGNTVAIRKSYSSRTSAAIKERYVPNIRVCDFQGRYSFAVGSTIEVYGLEG